MEYINRETNAYEKKFLYFDETPDYASVSPFIFDWC